MTEITRNEAWELWLAQLRSPDAKKVTGQLESNYDNAERCCLGHCCHALKDAVSYTHLTLPTKA